MCAAFGHATSTQRSVDVCWKTEPERRERADQSTYLIEIHSQYNDENKHIILNKKWLRSMWTDSRGRSSLTPFILLHSSLLLTVHPSSLRGVRLNFRGCAAKVLYDAQLPRRSSSRVGAFGETSGKEKNGASRSTVSFQRRFLHFDWSLITRRCG